MNDRKPDVTRRVVVDLKKVEGLVPRTEDGDPNFKVLSYPSEMEEYRQDGRVKACWQNSILSVFSPEQVVALVNRALYQMEYSRTIHRERSQQLRDREKPVREAAKRLFPTLSWSNLSEEQIKQAVNTAYPPKEGR